MRFSLATALFATLAAANALDSEALRRLARRHHARRALAPTGVIGAFGTDLKSLGFLVPSTVNEGAYGLSTDAGQAVKFNAEKDSQITLVSPPAAAFTNLAIDDTSYSSDWTSDNGDFGFLTASPQTEPGASKSDPTGIDDQLAYQDGYESGVWHDNNVTLSAHWVNSDKSSIAVVFFYSPADDAVGATASIDRQTGNVGDSGNTPVVSLARSSSVG